VPQQQMEARANMVAPDHACTRARPQAACFFFFAGLLRVAGALRKGPLAPRGLRPATPWPPSAREPLAGPPPPRAFAFGLRPFALGPPFPTFGLGAFALGLPPPLPGLGHRPPGAAGLAGGVAALALGLGVLRPGLLAGSVGRVGVPRGSGRFPASGGASPPVGRGLRPGVRMPAASGSCPWALPPGWPRGPGPGVCRGLGVDPREVRFDGVARASVAADPEGDEGLPAGAAPAAALLRFGLPFGLVSGLVPWASSVPADGRRVLFLPPAGLFSSAAWQAPVGPCPTCTCDMNTADREIPARALPCPSSTCG
jgi:hypothetical protein